MSAYTISSVDEFMKFNPDSEATASEPHTVTVTCDLDFKGANVSYATVENTKNYITWDFGGHVVKNISYSGNGGWYFVRARNVSNVKFENLSIAPSLSTGTVILFFIKTQTSGTGGTFDNIRVESSCVFSRFDGVTTLSAGTRFRLCAMRGQVNGNLYFPVSWTKSTNYINYATMCSSASLVSGSVVVFSSLTSTTSGMRCYRCFSANSISNGDGYHKYFVSKTTVRFCHVADFGFSGSDWCDVGNSQGSVFYSYSRNDIPTGDLGDNVFTVVDDICAGLNGFEGTGKEHGGDELVLADSEELWTDYAVISVYGRYAGEIKTIKDVVVKLPSNGEDESKTATVTLKLSATTSTTEISTQSFVIAPGEEESTVTIDFSTQENGVCSPSFSATYFSPVTFVLECSGCTIQSMGSKDEVFARYFFVNGGRYTLPCCSLKYEVDEQEEADKLMWIQKPEEFAHLDDGLLFWCISPEESEEEEVTKLIWGVGQMPFCTASGVAVSGGDIYGNINTMLYPKLFRTFMFALAMNTVTVKRKVKKKK